jgi:hypothetical protein
MHLTKLRCQQLLPKSRAELIRAEATSYFDFKIDQSCGVIIFESDAQFYIAPYIKDLDQKDDGYRRAQAEDGVSAKLLSNPVPKGLSSSCEIGAYQRERVITSDQSNQSFVLDDAVIIKWQLVATSSQGGKKQELLSKNGFTHLPKYLGSIYWQDRLVATVNKYIPNSQDGWSWCVEYAKAADSGSWVDQLANLTKQMHQGLSDLNHGDFHIGQIIKSRNLPKLWVIDFDGDPLAINNPQSSDQLRDIASMCASFFHVGAVAIKYGANESLIKHWIVNTKDKFLTTYFNNDNYDLPNLHQVMRSLEDRELVYADKFLPHWRYAPEFAIKYMKELGYGSN